ncbi:MAG: hypothetical protein LBG07_08710, partial [Treponema sp.]|nr:hypothetical protein [Treponema sp.]
QDRVIYLAFAAIKVQTEFVFLSIHVSRIITFTNSPSLFVTLPVNLPPSTSTTSLKTIIDSIGKSETIAAS